MVIVECGLALSGLRLHQDQQGPLDRASGGAARAAPRLRVPAVRQGVHHAQHVPPAPAGPHASSQDKLPVKWITKNGREFFS